MCAKCIEAQRLAQQSKSRGDCGGCLKSVLASDKAVGFNGSVWHADCFKCNKCSGSLQGGAAEVSGKYYCGACFQSVQREAAAGVASGSESSRSTEAPEESVETQEKVEPRQRQSAGVCGGCQKDVTSGQIVKMMGRMWHLDCVKCHHCKSKIEGNQVADINGEPHCVVCALRGQPEAAAGTNECESQCSCSSGQLRGCCSRKCHGTSRS